MNTPEKVPNIVFKTHSHDKKVCGENPFAWTDVHADEIFANKKIVLFALPGAFTPTCSGQHLPGYEEQYEELIKMGIDDVICLSVNDAFVMNEWKEDQKIKKVKMLPDGNGEFTREMGMLVDKTNLGFGKRSWRYSMYVENGEIRNIFEEPGKCDDCLNDPFEVSDAHTMCDYLRRQK